MPRDRLLELEEGRDSMSNVKLAMAQLFALPVHTDQLVVLVILQIILADFINKDTKLIIEAQILMLRLEQLIVLE